MNHRIAPAAALCAVLAACGQKEDASAPGVAPPEVAASAATDAAAIAPPITSPDEVTDPAEPPSYEVGIAAAAATRNKALERCATQPEAVRTQCEQEANASFNQSETDLQDLRGNKE